ncbi:transcription termination factor 2 [Microplitis demolitor]|uniref:transcription termination factor 2 n=1 Tax=Microplitis demolitor TaxID=69319 RepID=UPI0004CD45D8|nr:transcription termination factor 2 [Microplitis demolitor]XP_014295223.1 transcription termination factor 2 [Microplitis demolitor]
MAGLDSSITIYSSDDDQVIDDSKSRYNKCTRFSNQFIQETDDESLTDDEDKNPADVSIIKAIRRSIFNVSRVQPTPSETEDSESDVDVTGIEDQVGNETNDDEKKSSPSLSDQEDDEDFGWKNRGTNKNIKKKKKTLVLTSDDDDEDENYKAEDKHNENSHSIDSGKNTTIDTSADISHEDKTEDNDSCNNKISKKKQNIDKNISHKSINLSSEIISSNDNSKVEYDEYEIVEEDSVHQKDTQPEIIDIESDKSAPATDDEQKIPPKRSIPKLLNKSQLKKEIKRLSSEIERSKILLMQVNVEILPDKGKKLRISMAKNQEQIEEYKRQMNQLKETEESNSSIASTDLSHNLSSDKDNSLNDPNFNLHHSHNSSGENLNYYQKFNRAQLLKPTASTVLDGLGKKALETFKNEQALTIERLEHLHGSLESRPAEDYRAEDPRGLVIRLMPHQQHALAWLLWREKQKPRGGVLADDMGLGKTLTMISLVIKTLADDSSDEENDDNDDDDDDEWLSKGRQSKFKGGTLVVCPASLINQWKNEVDNRCKRGVLVTEVYHGTNREKAPRRLARNDIVITTYNLLVRESKNNGQIYQITWKRVILDEAHAIRNHKSQACEAVCQLKAHKRWALTGTPIHNKEMDLFAILKFLKCSPFDDIRVWKRWVENKSDAGVERLATVMKTLMLRRTKQELTMKGEIDSLPEKHTDIIKVSLDKDERLVYDKVMMYSRTIFAQFLHQRAEKETLFQLGAANYNKSQNYHNAKFNKAQQQLLARHADVKSHQILVLLLRLRQICCHPSLIHAMLDKEEIEMNGIEEKPDNDDLIAQMARMDISHSTSDHGGNDDDDDGEIGVDERVSEHLLTSENPVFDSDRCSSKLSVIIKLARDILEKREKLIIVSQWTTFLKTIGDNLSKIPGATYEMFSGQVAVKNRQGIVDSFNARGNPKILLLSLCAGGVGLNLVGGNHLLLVDIHWNPQLESQAQDRIYRFGQKKNVYIYKIICTDTIEERIQQLQEKKMALAASVLGGAKKGSAKLSLDDLKSLFSM